MIAGLLRNVLRVSVCLGIASCGDAENPRLLGFSSTGAEHQGVVEERLLGGPSGARMAEAHAQLTARPLHAGTQANRDAAEFFGEQLLAYGFDSVAYHRYEVLLPRPIERSLTLLEPDSTVLSLDEPPFPMDESSDQPGVLPPFNAYSADGDVTGEVVYVNYGMPEDYRVLDSLGVSVAGRIVLARYGNGWRGVKPRLAAQRGALGALLYSDPADDGFIQGPVLPDGPWRPEHGVQSGSVLDMPRYPGDPQTPGYASTFRAERIPLAEASTILPIPVQPISYAAARPILENVAGREAPESWKGGLPVSYQVGPGPAAVRLRLRFDWSLHPITNVVGLLFGAQDPDRWVMVGGHRDAWSFGGRDPISGTVSLLESARTLAEVSRRTPFLRTVAVTSWDAEEYGLIGSTEYGEEFAEELSDRVVLYINRESYTAGPFRASGSHALQPLVNDVARTVRSPADPEQAVYDGWLTGADEDGVVDHGGWTDVRLGALGSGSDYAVFLDHLGIPSLDLRFDAPNGFYHSRYDTHQSFVTYGDPDFVTGERLAEVVSVLVARVANAEVLPFDYTATAETIEGYLVEVEAELESRGLRVDLRGVRRANDRLAFSAGTLNAVADALLRLSEDERATHADLRRHLNETLRLAEQDFLHADGLPGRPWYRHLLYAPGYDDGYGAKPLPGLREAVERGATSEARDMVTALEEALLRVVDRFTEAMEQGKVLSGVDDD